MTTLSLKSSSPGLNPTSAPPESNREKRPNPKSSPSDLALASSPTYAIPAKKSKPNITDQEYFEAELASIYLTPEDFNLSRDEYMTKSVRGMIKAMKEKHPNSCTGFQQKLPESLPDGYTWGYYAPGSGVRSFLVKMLCTNCGEAHLNEDCPKKGTPEAAEYKKQNFPILRFPILRSFSCDETKP